MIPGNSSSPKSGRWSSSAAPSKPLTLPYALGKVDAEHFYVEELGWSRQVFRTVAWEIRDSTLERTTDMFRSLLAKQGSGFCGTQSKVSLWDSSRDDKCPNCHQVE